MNQNLLAINELSLQLTVPKSWVYSRTRETGPESIPTLRVGKAANCYLCFKAFC
jgi:hypothetical protein